MKQIGIIIASFFIFSSCGKSIVDSETTTSGNICIYSDEAFAPIVNNFVKSYQYSYPEAKISNKFLPENEAMQAFVKDTARLIFFTRELNEDENKYFKSIQIEPQTTHIATDAVAFIVHPSNPDSLLSTSQVEKIFSNQSKKWNEIKGKNRSNEDIIIAFDHNNSSNVRFATEKLHLNFDNKNIFAAGGHEQIIEYVKTHPNAIGVIGVNWVSDHDDSTAMSFINQVKVVGLSTQEHPSSENDYFQPYQAYIAQGLYPYTRKLYLISREPKTGLGTGLSSYISSDIGQKIVLKSGLMPATAPVRLVKFHKNSEE